MDNKALVDLLAELYTPEELFILVRRLRNGWKLACSLPGKVVEAIILVYAVVDLLERCSRIDAEFFIDILGDRPGAVDRITSIASRYDVDLPALCPQGRALEPALRALLTLLDADQRPASLPEVIEDAWFQELEERHPEHFDGIHGLRVAWQLRLPSASRPRRDVAAPGVDPTMAPAGGVRPSFGQEGQERREAVTLEPPLDQRSLLSGYAVLLRPGPGSGPESLLRFAEAVTMLKAVLLRRELEHQGLHVLDGLILCQRSSALLLVDRDSPAGILLAITIIADWMAEVPLVGGLTSGRFQPWLTPFLQRDIGGSAPLRVNLLARDAAARSASTGAGVIRVRQGDWADVQETMRQVAPGWEPPAEAGPDPQFSPSWCASAPIAQVLRRIAHRCPRAADHDLRSLVAASEEVQAIAVQVELHEADELAISDSSPRLGALLLALQEVGEGHLPALLRLLGVASVNEGGQGDLLQLRRNLVLESTASGFRVIGVGAIHGLQRDSSSVEPILDWLATVVAELEARNIPARVGLATRSVHRMAATHAAHAGYPWIFFGPLLEEVMGAASKAMVTREDSQIRLRPCLTARAMEQLWPTGPAALVDREGALLVLPVGALQKVADDMERELRQQLGPPEQPLWRAVRLDPDFPLHRSNPDARSLAARILSPVYRHLIYGSLSVATKDGLWHAMLEGLLVMLPTCVWAMWTAGVVVGTDGFRLGVFLLLGLLAITAGAWIFTFLGSGLFERLIVVRVFPTLERYHFRAGVAECFERYSLRIRLALAQSTPGLRASALRRESGFWSNLLWWRFVLGRGRTRFSLPGAETERWPALRWPLPKGRLRPWEIGLRRTETQTNPVRDPLWTRRWLDIPADARPPDLREPATISAVAGAISYALGGLLTARLWQLVGPATSSAARGAVTAVFIFIPVLAGALMNRAFYLRLCHINLNMLYLRGVPPHEHERMFAQHREFTYLSVLNVLLVLIALVIPLGPMLAASGLALYLYATGFVVVCSLAPKMGANTVLLILLGAVIWLLFSCFRGASSGFAWSMLTVGLVLGAVDLARAYAPYRRLDDERQRRLESPLRSPHDQQSSRALIPAESGVRMVEIYAALVRSALHIIADTGHEDAPLNRVRLPISRAALESAAWFVSDQQGNAIVLGGPGIREVGFAAQRGRADVRELYEGGPQVSARIGELIQHARAGQIIEVFVYPNSAAGYRRIPTRLFVQAIDAEGLATGFLGCAVPADLG